MAAPEAFGKFALVLLEEELAPSVGELAGGLARLLGRVRFDVLNAIKRNPHVPFEDLAEPQAAEAVKLLADAGARAAAVPAERLPAFPKVFTVHKAVPADAGLTVQTDYVGTLQELPWDQVAALSAATLAEGRAPAPDEPRGPSVGGQLAKLALGVAIGIPVIPSFGPRRPAPGPAPRAPEPYEVLALAPFGAAVEMRFRADMLDYACLGGRMTGNSGVNFRAFAGEVLRSAGSARVSPAARALAEGGSPPPMGADQFARYNRWLKLLASEGL